MKVFVYMRVSTDKQDLVQQRHTISEWLTANQMQAAYETTDEGISGGVSYRRRSLAKVLPLMSRGDILLCSELSRLGRSMADISDFVHHELAPRGIRLVAIKSNYDVDTAAMNAQAQLMLNLLVFAAQMEKEMIQTRTQAAIDARKQAIESNGGFVAKKSGRYVTKLGAPADALPKARQAAANLKRERAAANPTNQKLWSMLTGTADHSTPNKAHFEKCVLLCAEQDIKTVTGKTINVTRLRTIYNNLKKIYA